MAQANNNQMPIPQNQQYSYQQTYLQTNLNDQINQNPAINYGASQDIQGVAYQNPRQQLHSNSVNNLIENHSSQPQHYPVNNNFEGQKPSHYGQKVQDPVQNNIQGQLISYQENKIQSQKPLRGEIIQ